jgi:arylsulfatase A-like enzyme
MKKQLIALPILGCSLFIFNIATEAEKKLDTRPNIIFILADDHAKTAISAYGGINAGLAPTPNIDRIAKDGAIFNNMFCTNAICGPSRACLLTGTYSTTNGFYQNEGGIRFDSAKVTSALLLQKAGYNTAIIGKWHLFLHQKASTTIKFTTIHGNKALIGIR